MEQKKAFEKAIGEESEATVADFYYVRLTAFGEWIATSKIQIERKVRERRGARKLSKAVLRKAVCYICTRKA